MKYDKYSVCVIEANAFYELASQIAPNENLADFLSGMMYPYIVNLTLSCELYIKAITMAEGKTFERIHHLNDLFENLSTKNKNEIKSIINKELQIDVESELNKMKNAFVDWRYAFENEVKISITSIKAIADALNIFVNNNLNN